MDSQEKQELIIGTKDKIRHLSYKMKPNPHNWPIIDKWNYREYKKIKTDLFDVIEDTIDKIMLDELPRVMEKKFSEFADVKNIHIVDGALQTRLELNDFPRLRRTQDESWSGL